MEAKDTVMSSEKQREIAFQNREMGSRHFYSAWQRLCDEQAKISFNAGIVQGKLDLLLDQPAIIREAKEAGMREVVEFVNKHINTFEFNALWHAFLKEKGLVKV